MVQQMKALRKNVRILLVGEKNVGKTSLILTLVSEEFPEEVPRKAEEITIPADVTPERVPTHIVDYSAVEQNDEQLAEEIQRAHVICVVFSAQDEITFDLVRSKWLPFIRESLQGQTSCPVLLVANKIDLVEHSLIDMMINVMEDYPEVESCIECSAKAMRNISELFYYAQKSVLHPTQPLYTMAQNQLTSKCKKALSRIFKICDIDGDGILNDQEIILFQNRCFNVPLQPNVLEDVKGVIGKNLTDGLSRKGVTLPGFIFLHQLFIERGRSETTWTVLRKFGYDDQLNLSKEYLRPDLKVPTGCSAELSHKGHSFLSKLFDRHDKDRDGALCPAEVEDLFFTCPTVAWDDDVRFNVPTKKKDYWVTQTGFICYWTLTTLYDYPRTLEYLGYFGYPSSEYESQITAIHVTREKKIDLAKRQTSRSVYQCHVFGAAGVGKTTFCTRLIGINESPAKAAPSCTINIIHVLGQEKFLVLRDFDLEQADAANLSCDVLCLMYDCSNPDSFQQIADFFTNRVQESKIPVLIVGSKVDQKVDMQNYVLQPEEFCDKYNLPAPSYYSLESGVEREMYLKLATMAAFPRFQPAWVLFCKNQTRYFQQLLPVEILPLWWKTGVGLAAATAAGFLLFRMVIKPDISSR